MGIVVTKPQKNKKTKKGIPIDTYSRDTAERLELTPPLPPTALKQLPEVVIVELDYWGNVTDTVSASS